MSAKPEKILYPPYVSYSFFTSFINGLRENGIPMRIDRSIMPKASGSMVSGILGALRYLNLTDENSKPTSMMKDLVEASDEDRKPLLKKMLEDGYQFLFTDPGLDLSRATGQQVAELFRKQNITGSTVSKSIAFFLAAAKTAGITVSSHVKPPPTPRVAPKKTTTKRESEFVEEDDDDQQEGPQDEDMVRFQIPIPGKRSATVIVPNDLEPGDWTMLTTMLDAYIKRIQST